MLTILIFIMSASLYAVAVKQACKETVCGQAPLPRRFMSKHIISAGSM